MIIKNIKCKNGKYCPALINYGRILTFDRRIIYALIDKDYIKDLGSTEYIKVTVTDFELCRYGGLE